MGADYREEKSNKMRVTPNEFSSFALLSRPSVLVGFQLIRFASFMINVSCRRLRCAVVVFRLDRRRAVGNHIQASQVVLKKGEERRLVVVARLHVAKAVAFVWEDLRP